MCRTIKPTRKKGCFGKLHVWLKNVVGSSLVAILINASMNDSEWMQYRRGKKGETHWIGSALRQGEVKTLQHSDYTMWWFCGSLRIRWRHVPQQIAVPFAVCIFGGFVFCSASRRKTKPSIIRPCHSFISYSILLLILKPALYLLIYLTSLYFWWWGPPMGGGGGMQKSL